jgi:hypothetical protein
MCKLIASNIKLGDWYAQGKMPNVRHFNPEQKELLLWFDGVDRRQVDGYADQTNFASLGVWSAFPADAVMPLAEEFGHFRRLGTWAHLFTLGCSAKKGSYSSLSV